MKNIVIGILAHVDAGKTTLSEAMLYVCGEIRKMGRVDSKDAFLDTHPLEKSRGITIFSKQAVFSRADMRVTLLDTPGHMDFSAEMERTLQVLDYAILVINGADGVQGHTLTLWQLLKKYRIPVFLFVNKMDQPGTEKESLLFEVKHKLSDNCVEFGEQDAAFHENAAVCQEQVLEYYLENGCVTKEQIAEMIAKRRIFPCFFGSALKVQGVEELLEGLADDTRQKDYPDEFGARVFKISREEQGTRLTHLKITGGRLKVKDFLSSGEEGGDGAEKINQIRIYSGAKFEVVTEAEAGMVCAVTGPVDTRPGQGFGFEALAFAPVLIPVLTYQVILPEGCDPVVMLSRMKDLEEEQPELHLVWNESLQEIQVQIMGEVQIEVLGSLIRERFGIEVAFGAGNIVYRETIEAPVTGAGHFEPLRHYAEVHLLLEPGERGSGLVFSSCCSEDRLDRNWQRLILSHLKEREHPGVLTGAGITDMKITLTAGRAHQKHTEGGDFRQATYRALRQGLMKARSVLLEPVYEFGLEVPEKMVGKAMADIERMSGSFHPPEFADGFAVLKGTAPAATMCHYQREVASYTKGLGRFSCFLKGYEPCHNTSSVIAAANYDPLADPENPPGSVFCTKGAGFYVEWDKVGSYLHEEGGVILASEQADTTDINTEISLKREETAKTSIGEDEIESIYQRTFYANSGEKQTQRKIYDAPRVIRSESGTGKPTKRVLKKEEYLLVDGYNIIFAWKELKELAAVNVDSARGKLLDILCNYQAIRGGKLIVVFDAYRVQGHQARIEEYHNINLIYTREAETADRYIERFAHDFGAKYEVTVATSDATEQVIIMGQGCHLLSAAELEKDVSRIGREIQKEYEEKQKPRKSFVMDMISQEQKNQIEMWKNK